MPKDLKSYNKKPWKALRDVKAAALWRAEEIRAEESGDFDVDAALSGMDLSPFDWTLYNDKTLFVVWSAATDKRKKPRYRLSPTSIHTLLRLVGGAGK